MGKSSSAGVQVRPVHPAHLDDAVSLADPAIFGCNAVGIHLQGTVIKGIWHSPLSWPFSTKGQPHLGAPKANRKLLPACSPFSSEQQGLEQWTWQKWPTCQPNAPQPLPTTPVPTPPAGTCTHCV